MKLNYFNYKPFNNQYLLTNDFGEYTFLSPEHFDALIHNRIEEYPDAVSKLLASHFIYTESNLEFSSVMANRLRAMKNYVLTATSLHIFVVTTACNLRCVYCQANNGVCQPNTFMTIDTAKKAVDIALSSPARCLSFEFQGGEPLLNIETIKFIVEYAEEHKDWHEIEYNIVTNLTLLNQDAIDFFKTYHIHISTSIDGGSILHNTNRPFPNQSGSFEQVTASISRLRSEGFHVGAIQTTTKQSLTESGDIINTYIELGFDGLFVRPLTPLGKALQEWDTIGYTPEEFVEFYSSILNQLIQINKHGTYIREDHASILMKKLLGNGVNYMELRSPCGAGIGQLAYFADGNIFTCDEGRMLFEMGNDAFLLGNVSESRYEDLIKNGSCKTTCASSVLESIPSCCDCIYMPYCGTCPVVNYALKSDIIEKQPRDYKCKIYAGMFDAVFRILQSNDVDSIKILESWSN